MSRDKSSWPDTASPECKALACASWWDYCLELQGTRDPGPALGKQSLESVLSAWVVFVDLGLWIQAQLQ